MTKLFGRPVKNTNFLLTKVIIAVIISGYGGDGHRLFLLCRVLLLLDSPRVGELTIFQVAVGGAQRLRLTVLGRRRRSRLRFPFPRLNSVLFHRDRTIDLLRQRMLKTTDKGRFRSIYVVELKVESTCVADGFALVVAPP